MITALQSSKPGRPKRNPIDVLRTKVWFYAVKARSGLASAYALELTLEPEIVRQKVAGVLRPRKWDGYQSGLRVPQKIAGKPDSVGIAEQRYPGTASYFQSPLWAVLRGDKVDQLWINDQLKNMDPEILAILAASEPQVLHHEPNTEHLKPFNLSTAYRLAEVGTFSALAALILLVKKSELIASPDLREMVLRGYHHCQIRLKDLPELAPVALELFHTIDLKCKFWVFPTPEWRMDIVIFSREQQDPPREEA